MSIKDYSKDQAWKLIACGAVIAAGAAARTAMDKGWRLARHEEPPKDPVEQEWEWKDAILWSVFSGASVGLLRLMARGGVHRLRERAPGRLRSGDRAYDHGRRSAKRHLHRYL